MVFRTTIGLSYIGTLACNETAAGRILRAPPETFYADAAGIRERLRRAEEKIVMSTEYLLKTEPSEYSFADLQRDRVTIWDGITNPAAVKNLREMMPGARLIIYETGERRCAVGTAVVESVDASDPKNPRVTIKAGKPLVKLVTLDEIKASKLFAESPLVRMGRLSVVPLTSAQHKFLTGS